MKAMILAAGRGMRVEPLTDVLPKPMIPLLGKPVMAYLVEHLARHGVTQIMVNVAHLHEKMEAYFGNGQHYGLEIGYSFEGYATSSGEIVPEPMGSAGGMRKIHDFSGFFADTTVVLCGDALIDLDIIAAVAEHRARGALATVITQEVASDKVSRYGVVMTDDSGRVTAFQEKPPRELAHSHQASTGIYIFEPAVMDLIPAGAELDIGSQLLPLMVQRGLPLYAQCRQFSWIDIGTAADYWSAMQALIAGEVENLPLPGRQLAPGVHAGLNTHIDWVETIIEGPVYIGAGTRIDAGAHIIGPCWIGPGCHIGAGARVVRTVVFSYTRIAPDVELSDSIVCREHAVGRDGVSRKRNSGRAMWEDARSLANVGVTGILAAA